MTEVFFVKIVEDCMGQAQPLNKEHRGSLCGSEARSKGGKIRAKSGSEARNPMHGPLKLSPIGRRLVSQHEGEGGRMSRLSMAS